MISSGGSLWTCLVLVSLIHFVHTKVKEDGQEEQSISAFFYMLVLRHGHPRMRSLVPSGVSNSKYSFSRHLVRKGGTERQG